MCIAEKLDDLAQLDEGSISTDRTIFQEKTFDKELSIISWEKI